MHALEKITQLSLPSFPDFSMDALQENVMANLHLELVVGSERYIVTPSFDVEATEANNGNSSQVEIIEFVLKNKELLDELKRYIILNLSVYSDLLESNSYMITFNGYLVIARIEPLDAEYDFEVQLYTLEEMDKFQYREKIYIGRDFFSLKDFHRNFFGLGNIMYSVKKQFTELLERCEGSTLDDESKSFLNDVSASADDAGDAAERLFEDLPGSLSLRDRNKELLKAANQKFRELKHTLQDLQVSLNDWERHLYEREEQKLARYVTKFKKDISDDIDFINAKVNSRITDFINEVSAVNF